MSHDFSEARMAKETRGVRRAIWSRQRVNGVMMRTLSCAHQVREPRGGEAAHAQFALCRECLDIEVTRRKTKGL